MTTMGVLPPLSALALSLLNESPINSVEKCKMLPAWTDGARGGEEAGEKRGESSFVEKGRGREQRRERSQPAPGTQRR